MRIVIDPGHGGQDPGAVANGLQEKELVLDTCVAAEKLLLSAGIDVHLTRRTDIFLSLQDRVAMANQSRADLFISVHCNAGGGTGFESFRYRHAPQRTRDLQESLHRVLSFFFRSEGLPDRGEKSALFYVLRHTAMPAVLLEFLFLDHPEDANWLARKCAPQLMGDVLAMAVAETINPHARK